MVNAKDSGWILNKCEHRFKIANGANDRNWTIGSEYLNIKAPKDKIIEEQNPLL